MSEADRRRSPLRGLLSRGRGTPGPSGDGPSEGPGPGRLGFVVLAGPTAWLTAFLVNVFLIRGSCLAPAVAARYALVVGAGLVALLAVGLAFAAWRSVRASTEPGAGGAAGRDRFMAIAGIGWSGISVVLAIALLATLVALDPCLAAPGGERL